MSDYKFAVFILTYGRPDNVKTVQALRRSNYTGEIYIIIDNEDERAEEYFAMYGDKYVIQFDKKAEALITDVADTQDDRRAVVYARNASQRIAKELGYDYILQFDDDYSIFYYKSESNGKLHTKLITNFDGLVDAFVKFLVASDADTVAFSQGGDFIGGINQNWRKQLMRKAMNGFFFRTNRPVEFFGKINEDVNAYVVHGSRGRLFFTVARTQLQQAQTQQVKGGLTDIYLHLGTYVKSFYSVMMAPSCVKVKPMGITDRRLHHFIKWDNAVPKILNEKYKKYE